MMMNPSDRRTKDNVGNSSVYKLCRTTKISILGQQITAKCYPPNFSSKRSGRLGVAILSGHLDVLSNNILQRNDIDCWRSDHDL